MKDVRSNVMVPYAGDARGFSMVELGVAILIFCIGFIGMTKMQKVAIRSNAYSMQMTEAANVMKSTSERLMGCPTSDIELGGPGTLVGTVTRSAPCEKPTTTTYTPTWTITQVPGTDLREVVLRVAWKEQGSDHSVSVTFYK